MDFWPADFPSGLAEPAFWSNEPAWEPHIASQVVDWLGFHQYAVLGAELWVVRDGLINTLPIGQTGMPEVHGNTVSRLANEPWAAFVSRSASETVVYLRSFRCPPRRLPLIKHMHSIIYQENPNRRTRG
jgi:hypothetical protein